MLLLLIPAKELAISDEVKIDKKTIMQIWYFLCKRQRGNADM
jgi:hypothetical protein